MHALYESQKILKLHLLAVSRTSPQILMLQLVLMKSISLSCIEDQQHLDLSITEALWN